MLHSGSLQAIRERSSPALQILESALLGTLFPFFIRCAEPHQIDQNAANEKLIAFLLILAKLPTTLASLKQEGEMLS